MELLSLQSEGGLDSARVGSKAARLAAAKRCGLPVLDGLVIPVEVSAAVLDTATAEVAVRGVHAARLAVMESTNPDLSTLASPAAALGNDLVVRSSSPLEASPEFAGAFTSYLGVTTEELATAVRGVWASAFVARPTADYDGDAPAAPRMAVLVQPMIDARCAGTARVGTAGTVTVVVVMGSPAPLLAGWVRGETAVVNRDGVVSGDAALDLTGAVDLNEVAALARRVHGALGDDLIEWAATASGLVLLQAQRAAAPVPPSPLLGSPGAVVPPAAAGVARLVHAFAGELGEALVLPVVLAGAKAVDPVPETRMPAEVTQTAASAAWSQVMAMAPSLGRALWGAVEADGSGAAATLADLRGGEIAAATGRVGRLPRAAGADVSALLSSLGTVAAWLLQVGVLTALADLWALSPAAITAHFRGAGVTDASAAREARRRALLRWEPFVYTAVRDTGSAVDGEAAGAGVGAGEAVVLLNLPTQAITTARMVLVAPRPVPQLAPLLWGAAALVTTGGSAAAHLVEVARSRAVPVVVGCHHQRLLALVGRSHLGSPGPLVAVDGDRGRVVVDAVPE